MAVDIGVVQGLIELRDDFTGVLTRTSEQMAAAGKKWQKLGADMSAAGQGMTAAITLPIVALGGLSIKAASDFESSFAGVRKTVDATEIEFGELAEGIRDLSQEIPVNVNELNRIGEAAGQLGIKTDNILLFTRTMADLGVTTNLSAEEAATALARLANITGLPQESIDRLGSTVVALGNNFATTEAEIVEFGLRMAGAGEIAGLTEADILSIGAAMSSVGVQAEAGGTAVQKVLLNMTGAVANTSEELVIFADTAGLSASEFAQVFEQDAATAFRLFVEGLGRQGTDAFETLEQLNLQDQRLIRSFLSLAGAGDVLARAMQTGNTAFEENTALAIEAEQRYATFESQMTLFWNRIKDVAITLGQALIPVLQNMLSALDPVIGAIASMAQWFADLPTPIQTTIVAIAGLAAAAGPILLIAGQLATAWGAFAIFLPTLTGAIVSVVAVITGPVGWAVAGVALLLAWKPVRTFLVDLGKVVIAKLKGWVDVIITATQDWWKSTEDGRKFLLALAKVIKDDVVKVVKIAINIYKSWIGFQIKVVKEVVIAIAKFIEWTGAIDQTRKGIIAITGRLVELVQVVGDVARVIPEMVGGLDRVRDIFTQFNPLVATGVDKLLEWSNKAQAASTASVELGDDVTITSATFDRLNDSLGTVVGSLDTTTDDVDDLGDSLVNLERKARDIVDLSGNLIDLTGRVGNAFVGSTGNVDDNRAAYDLLKRTYDVTNLSQMELVDLMRALSLAEADGVITTDQLEESMERLGNTIGETTDEVASLSSMFSDVMSGMLSGSQSFGDSIENVFRQQATGSFNDFVGSMSQGFTQGREEGKGFADSLVSSFSGAGGQMSGIANAIAAGFVATSGEMEDVMVGAMTSITAFAQGDMISGFIAAAGTIIGIFKNLFGGKNKAAELAKRWGFEINDELKTAVNEMAKTLGDIEPAMRQLLGDVIRDVGIQAVEDLRKFTTEARNTLADLDRGTITSSQAVTALGDSVGELLARFVEAGGGVLEFVAIGDIFLDVINRMTLGQITAAEATTLLNNSFEQFLAVAIETGEGAIEVLARVVEAATNAGLSVEAIAEALSDTWTAALNVMAERAQFLITQSGDLLAGVMQMLENTANVTVTQVEFAATSVLQAFNAMVEAGVPMTEIMAEIGDLFGDVNDLGVAMGIDLGDEFARLGEVMTILADDHIQRVIGRLDGMTAAAVAAGNMGLLTQEQFIATQNTLINTFNQLVEGGLTSEEALAALAGPTQDLIDLSEQYGFKVNDTAQELLDMAEAQGIVASQGLSMDDILIEGFNSLLRGLNELIEALGGVPVAFNDWSNASGDAADQALDDWGDTAQQLPNEIFQMTKKMAKDLTNIPVSFFVTGDGDPNTVPAGQNQGGGFAHGSGQFVDFGPGTTTTLHGLEQVVTAAEGAGIVGMVKSAIISARLSSGTSTLTGLTDQIRQLSVVLDDGIPVDIPIGPSITAPIIGAITPAVNRIPPIIDRIPPIVEQIPPIIERVPPIIDRIPPIIEMIPPIIEQMIPIVQTLADTMSTSAQVPIPPGMTIDLDPGDIPWDINIDPIVETLSDIPWIINEIPPIIERVPPIIDRIPPIIDRIPPIIDRIPPIIETLFDEVHPVRDDQAAGILRTGFTSEVMVQRELLNEQRNTNAILERLSTRMAAIEARDRTSQ